MLTDLVPGEQPPLVERVVVNAPYSSAGAVKPEHHEANPDLEQDAVDSLFDCA